MPLESQPDRPPSAAPPAAAAVTTSTFPYAQLKAPGPFPAGIDTTIREEYLSPPEFAEVFGITVDAFHVMPKWKRNQLKKARGLF
jgi:hypothetical protein